MKHMWGNLQMKVIVFINFYWVGNDVVIHHKKNNDIYHLKWERECSAPAIISIKLRHFNISSIVCRMPGVNSLLQMSNAANPVPSFSNAIIKYDTTSAFIDPYCVGVKIGGLYTHCCGKMHIWYQINSMSVWPNWSGRRRGNRYIL